MTKQRFVLSVDVSLPGQIRHQFPKQPGQLPSHVTLLRFETIRPGEQLTGRVIQAVRRLPPFELELSNVRPVHPTGRDETFTVSLAVAANDRLDELVARLCRAVGRPHPIYPPHCTLAKDLSLYDAERLYNVALPVWQPQIVQVAVVTLWEKELLPGSVYRPRSYSNLGSGRRV